MWLWSVCVFALTALALAAANGNDVHKSGWKPELLLTAGRYSLDSALLAHGGGGGGAGEGDAGVRVRGELHVTPLPRSGHDPLIIRLEIVDAVVERLTSLSQWRPVEHPAGLAGVWGVSAGAGGNVSAYLNAADSEFVRDYRRAIAAVLVVNADGVGEQEETRRTGPWGECTVRHHYHDDTTLRAALTHCEDDAADTTRVWRYTRDRNTGHLHTLVAEETIGGVGGAARARGWLRLTRGEGGRGRAGGGGLPEHLQLNEIRAEANDYEDMRARGVDVAAAWRAAVAAVAAGSGGTPHDAAALPALLDVIQRASVDQLHHMISSSPEHETRCAVLHAVGLAGTAAGVKAAHHALQLRHDPAVALAECYFQGLALARAPHEEAVSWAFEAAGSSSEPRVITAATLAAYSGSSRLTSAQPSLAKPLCKGDHCKSAWLLGLSALPAPSPLVLAALVQHAQQHEHAHVALHALAHYPPQLLPKDLAHELVKLSLDVPALPHGPRPLEVRAAALLLGVRLTAEHTPLSLPRVIRDVTRDPSPLGGELRRLLRALLPSLPSARAQRPLMAHPLLMLNGTSSYIERAAWSNALWRGTLTSVTACHAGLLRHQLVTLSATHRHDKPRELLRVAVLSRGMAAFTGDSDSDENVDCTINLSVLGTPLPPLTLYESTTQLMGALWAGAGSTPTPVVRARAVTRDTITTSRLMLGTVGRRHTVSAAVALDGHGAASLWQRTASGALTLRAAIVTNITVRAHTPFGTFSASHHTHTDPTLHIHADLDFYNKIRLCVRARTDAYDVTSDVAVARVRGAAASRRNVTLPPRTLSLGDADRLCAAASTDND